MYVPQNQMGYDHFPVNQGTMLGYTHTLLCVLFDQPWHMYMMDI
jgi:hypothetical protein